MSGALDPNASGGRADGEVAIVTQKATVSGWTDVEIRGGLEMMPASFDLGVTEHFPGALDDIQISKGDACTVTIGGDTVITGYINRVSRRVAAGQHTIRVSGRSRCQDLVDCSANFPQLSTSNASIGNLARQLIAPYAGIPPTPGITLQLPDGDGLDRPEYFSLTLTETPWEIISQVATYEGLLVHDDAKGDLVICKVGTASFASGFVQGQNVQEFGLESADDMLYSDYIPVLTAQDTLAQTGPGGNDAGATVRDPGVTRYRPLIVPSDQPGQGVSLAQQRATWEATRRRGRSEAVSLVCDSWRDSAGTLWTHNVLAPVNLPAVGLTDKSWIIATWTFIRNGERGTVAEITLMSPDAFAIEPTALNDQNWQIAQATAQQQGDIQLGQDIGTAFPGGAAQQASPNMNVRAGDGYGL